MTPMYVFRLRTSGHLFRQEQNCSSSDELVTSRLLSKNINFHLQLSFDLCLYQKFPAENFIVNVS